MEPRPENENVAVWEPSVAALSGEVAAAVPRVLNASQVEPPGEDESVLKKVVFLAKSMVTEVMVVFLRVEVLMMAKVPSS